VSGRLLNTGGDCGEDVSVGVFIVRGGLVGAMLSLIILAVVGTMSLIVLDRCGTLRDYYTY
jgi:hypothetical protein